MIVNKKILNCSNSRKIFVLLFLASVLSVIPLVTFEFI